MSAEPEEEYDFSNWNFPDDLLDKIKQKLREHMREAFRAFKAEGEWDYWGRSLVWELNPAESELWGDDLPITIKMTPSDFVNAVAREVKVRGDKAECLEGLRLWREAIDRAEALARAMPDEEYLERRYARGK